MTLHYVERGDPACPPVLLLHGGRDHARSWDTFAKAIQGQFYVIALDLRGHGRSDWVSDGNYDILDHLVDVAELIGHLDVRSLFIVGHSLGGNIALRYAGLFPDIVRGLVVIEGLGPSPSQIESLGDHDPLDAMGKWVASRRRGQHPTLRSYTTIGDAAARMHTRNPSLSTATSSHLARWGTCRQEDGSFCFSFDPALIVSEALDLSWPDKYRLWQRIAAPTLLLYGADSWASNPAEDGRERHFRHASTVVIRDAGHWLHLEQPARFKRVAQAFLLEHLARDAASSSETIPPRAPPDQNL